MKKILLISANQEKVPYPVAPLGLLYIANALKRSGFDASILDLCFSDNAFADLKKAIQEKTPDLIGLSIRNVDNLTFPKSVSYLPAVKEIVQVVKQCTNAPIVLGGSAFSLFPEQILKFMDCSWGVIGEGELALIELLRRFSNGEKDYAVIDNLVWRDNGSIRCNPIGYLDSSSDFILDYGFLDNRSYAHFAGMLNVQTKRGCQFKCAYCTYPAIEGKNYRLRSPQVIVEEIDQLQKKYDVRHVFFVDDIFTFPSEHAFSVCEAILKKGVKIQWSCFASPYNISKDLLMLMKKSGCTHIEWGTDALSDKVLKRLRKPFLMKDVFQASRLCKEAGIKSAHYVIFGAPGEDKDSLKESFTAIQKLDKDVIIAMIGIRIYPGTELHDISIREGVILKDADLLSPYFYLSREIPEDELSREVSLFAQENPHCIVPGLEIRSSEKMYSVLRKHYPEGPLWGYLEQ